METRLTVTTSSRSGRWFKQHRQGDGQDKGEDMQGHGNAHRPLPSLLGIPLPEEKIPGAEWNPVQSHASYFFSSSGWVTIPSFSKPACLISAMTVTTLP